MGTLWRSEEMKRVQLFIQYDSAVDTIDELGELGAIQFIDLNPEVNAFQRTFVNEVKRCDEMERRLRFIHEHIIREERSTGVPMVTIFASDELDTNVNIDSLETELEQVEKDLKQMSSNLSLLTRNNNELKEMMYVLAKDAEFFKESESPVASAQSQASADAYIPLLSSDEIAAQKSNVKISFITGVIQKDKYNVFERVLWRSLRGNMYLRNEEITETVIDPMTGECAEKMVFIVFFQGEQSRSRIVRICDSFSAHMYPCPESEVERLQALSQVNERLEEMAQVLENSHEAYRQNLEITGVNLERYTVAIRKHKSTYSILNLCDYDIGRRCLIAEGWCPLDVIDNVLSALSIAQHRAGVSLPSVLSIVETSSVPPTLFRTTEFTGQFQMIVDAYGIARYGEINPGVFTLMTFPFLFAVMFGDFGHGLILLLASGAMIYFEKKLKSMRNLNDIFVLLFEGRYLVFVMGVFSLFTGFLYNDYFSFPINLFGSRYQLSESGRLFERTSEPTYPIGIDPVWKLSANELFYYNSLKMKMSVVIGILQMTLGVVLSLFNYIHFKKKIDIIFTFIPQIVFMVCFFGYLIFIIFYKWMVFVPNQPFLLNILIDMALKYGNLPPEEHLYNGQNAVQTTLATLAIIALFLMFVPKPCIRWWQNKQKEKDRQRRISLGLDVEDPEEFDLSDVVINNSIHNVEYVLGCISNTASYLRLWALSLAHSELSLVFYEQVLFRTIKMESSFMVFIGFGVWGGATLAVLCMMEALSAFLHALRLHWVEFQNKFYSGDGYQFVPFSNKEVTEKARLEMYAISNPPN